MKYLSDIRVPAIGLGCMGMSEFYGATNDAQSLEALHVALDIGYRHFDTSDAYGQGHNEQLLGQFLAQIGGRRQEVLLATKFGIKRDPADALKFMFSGDRSYVNAACDASLKRLGVDHIDLYYVHRRDVNTPIEETIGALADLVKAGKIGAIGLSEVSAETLKKAHAVHPIAALQSEYSLWTRDVEQEILPLCEALDIAFVAYSPLGRGFLTGKLDKAQIDGTTGSGDLRAKLPRFQGENFDQNRELVKQLEQRAVALECTSSQLALAWLLHRYKNMHVIPGSKRVTYLAANFSALNLTLDTATVDMLGQMFDPGAIAGQRYPDALLKTVNL
jgi:aryl-alcohol dehydrogenase-like predicted oxidoreductase